MNVTPGTHPASRHARILEPAGSRPGPLYISLFANYLVWNLWELPLAAFVGSLCLISFGFLLGGRARVLRPASIAEAKARDFDLALRSVLALTTYALLFLGICFGPVPQVLDFVAARAGG